MRIDLNTRIPDAPDPSSSSTAGSQRAEGSTTRLSDTAKLSSDNARVQALALQAGAAPEIRQAKVAALAKSTSDGSYQVSSEQTAEAMLSQMRLIPKV